MGKKLTYTGVISIDESWSGLGVAIYVPGYCSYTAVYDIREKKKYFDLPLNTINSVSRWLDQLIIDCPYVQVCTLVLIEAQFHKKMQNLQYIVACAMRRLLTDARIEFISALKWKRIMGMYKKGQSHNQNKKDALKYVQDHSELILSHCHQNDHNIADAILIMNAYNNEHGGDTYQGDKSSYAGWPKPCPVCGMRTVFKNKCKNGDNAGREFAACNNKEHPEHATENYNEDGYMKPKKTFIGWLDEADTLTKLGMTNDLPKPQLGKRVRPGEHGAPPAKRQCVDGGISREEFDKFKNDMKNTFATVIGMLNVIKGGLVLDDESPPGTPIQE